MDHLTTILFKSPQKEVDTGERKCLNLSLIKRRKMFTLKLYYVKNKIYSEKEQKSKYYGTKNYQ